MTKPKLEGYKKIYHTGGSLVTVTMYNPTTGDIQNITVDDNDYNYGHGLLDGRFTLTELEHLRYTLKIDKEAQKQYQHSLGQVFKGDTIEVYKGRKIPKGTIAKITDIYTVTFNYKDTTYAVLDNGQKTNITNCKLVS